MIPTDVDCCIVGGGPAGLMLGLLLARAGVHVLVAEAQKDFDRDFRGDTVHASTLEVLDQIGLAERALELPHEKLERITLHTPERTLDLVSLERLRTRFPYVAVMPQSLFLEFLCERAYAYAHFHCARGAAVRSLVEEDGVVRGAVLHVDGESHAVRARLVVGADGRFSRMRKLAGFTAESEDAPMDVCWLRLPRQAGDGHHAGGFFVGGGRLLVCLPRHDAWQIGYVFPKGDFAELRAEGIDAFRRAIADTAPWLGDRVSAIEAWSGVHLLSVRADCLPRWHRPGLLLIGDAAHVMSPVGGVGINMAVGDAVEAANVLGDPRDPLLRRGAPSANALETVQRRRMRATRVTQTLQRRVQQAVVQRALSGRPFELPLPVRFVLATPGLRGLPLRVIGLGWPQARLAR